MNSRTNKKRNKNTTQKLWMNVPHNKNKKNRYFSRLSIRRSRRRRNNDDVFGDLAVPSLHDVTLKMHNVIDRADNAMLSFKPINYKRIHKRWKNKKYKVVSGGVGDGDEKLAEVKKGIVKLTGDVDALTGKVADIENGDATVSPGVAPKGDECLESKERRTFSGSLQDNNTVRISEVKPGTYDAFIEELAALGETATADADDDEGVVVEKENEGAVVKKTKEGNVAPIVKDSATATNIDAAAAAAGVAGAAAAAALFTDDHTPAVIVPKIPTLSEFKIEPETVHMDGVAPTFTMLTSASDGAITYSSNMQGVAMIDATNGKITLVSAGTVTFTATQAATSQYSTATKTSNTLTVNPAPPHPPHPPPPPPGPPSPPALSSEPLPWAALKARWIKINAIPNTKYTEELTQNASVGIAIKRQVVYDWLIKDPLDNGNSFFSNSVLYKAILEWLIRWDEFGGKIRTIVSIRGGQPLSGGAAAYIPTIMAKTSYNKTKVKFDSSLKEYKEPDQIARIRKSIDINAPEYGYFYTGFSSEDSNEARYTQGNFKDMITTLEGGGNIGIFGYGYSGSGKTYTLTNFENGKSDANGIAIQLIESLLTANYTIKLTVTELYCNKVKPDRGDKEKIVIDEKEKAPSYPDSFKNKPINSVPDFTQAIDAIKKTRVSEKRIKYTLNNPESSRGHLFYTFKLIKNGKSPGTLTICDMGGRENPIELSETSYMIIEDDSYNKSNKLRVLTDERMSTTPDACINESYVGQIAERKGNMLRFYVKDPNDRTKWLANPDGTLRFQHVKLEFVPGEKDSHGNYVGKNAKRITGAFIKDSDTPKCDSLLKATFGSFFTSSQEITEDFVRARLNITKEGKKTPGIQADEDQRVKKITESLNTFIDCCKEGIYINETINHLVAYVNFLSNVGEYLNNVEVKKAVIPLNEHVAGYTAVQAVYHPERHMYDPRSFIKLQYSNNLKTIMADQTKFDSITDSTDDTVGIISKLKDIKNPTTVEKNPSMLCFIACINYDNSQLKNKIATRNTLEFAMSVSASNGPPEKMAAANPKIVPAVETTFIPTPKEQNIKVTRPDLIKFAIKNSKLSNRIKEATSGDAKIEAIRKFASNNEDGESDYYKILKSSGKYIKGGIDTGQADHIIKAFIVEYMNRGNISKVLTQYTQEKNRKLVKAATPLAKGGAKVKTRKRESMREKKHRITRRRNRV